MGDVNESSGKAIESNGISSTVVDPWVILIFLHYSSIFVPRKERGSRELTIITTRRLLETISLDHRLSNPAHLARPFFIGNLRDLLQLKCSAGEVFDDK